MIMILKKTTSLLVIILLSMSIYAQTPQYFKNSRDERHLCGIFPVEVLEQDTVYNKWYNQHYLEFNLSNKKHKWVKT